MRRAIGYLGRALLWTVVVLLLAVVIVPKFLDRVYYQGPISDHYDGERFANTGGPTCSPFADRAPIRSTSSSVI